MNRDWQRITIGSLIEEGVILIHKDGNHGSNYPRADDFGADGIPFLTAKLIDDSGNINVEQAPRLSQAKAKAITFGFVEGGDVLLSHNATVGRVAIMPDLKETVLIGTSLTQFRLNPQRLLAKYLAAYFSSRDFQAQLAAVMSQTTRNQVPITAQRRLTIVYPPLPVQRSIASILGSLDDKISLNRTINQTLEQMAQAIFKSWFVDFDPVKAKIEAISSGDDPERAAMRAISGKSDAELDAMPAKQRKKLAETAALFPDELVESELGMIPKGWGVGSFSEIATLDTTPVKPFDEPDRMWLHFSIPAYDEKRAPLEEKGAAIKSQKYRVKPTSVLFSKLNPHFPRAWWPAIGKESNAICSTEFMQFLPVDPLQRVFVYCFIQTRFFQENVLSRVTGSTGSRQRAQPKAVVEMPVIVPDNEIRNHFSLLLESAITQTVDNTSSSSALSNIRDTLLPKLLSGEIEVGG